MSAAPIAATKVCATCRAEKNLSDFYRDNRAADGHLRECKECRRAYQNQRNAELRAALGDERYRAMRRGQIQKWRKENPGKATEHARPRKVAVRHLIEAHRAEYERLLLMAKRGEIS